MSIPKARCPCCQQMVLEPTMQVYARHKICVECFAKVRIENARTGRKKHINVTSRKEPVVIKYGTAEAVQKKNGKAVISEKSLSKEELEEAVEPAKTASKRKKNSVVTDEDYRQED